MSFISLPGLPIHIFFAARENNIGPIWQTLAKELGVESQVIFHNRFVSPEELVEFIGATDIYITPYRNEKQVVSGTLAYALGAGKAIISTPYWHAVELLDEGRERWYLSPPPRPSRRRHSNY